MIIQITIQGNSKRPRRTLAKKLVQAFSYAATGSLDNLKLFSIADGVWESMHGTVKVECRKGGVFHIMMDTRWASSLAARSLGVFEHLLDTIELEVQEVQISDSFGFSDVFQDFNSSNLQKVAQQGFQDDPAGWWDTYVLPVIEEMCS